MKRLSLTLALLLISIASGAASGQVYAKVAKAWQGLAQVGWYGTGELGYGEFYADKPRDVASLPGFRIEAFRPGSIGKLPEPAMPYALDFRPSQKGWSIDEGLRHYPAARMNFMATISDAGLKELAGLKNVKSLDLGGTQVTDVGLRELAALKSLRALTLPAPFLAGAPRHTVGDAGLKELAGLTQLEFLFAGHTNVTDDGLKHLARLKSLRTLFLTHTKITGAGLNHLAELKNLQVLHVNLTAVNDAGLKQLAGLKSLHTLNLAGAPLTDEGLQELAPLENLKHLYVVDNRGVLSDAGLQALCRLKNLQTQLEILDFATTSLTDNGMKELTKFKKLHTLRLYWARIGDESLKEIAKCKSLRNVRLHQTRATPEGVAELRRVRPDLTVSTE